MSRERSNPTPDARVARGYPPSGFFLATVFFGSIGLRLLLVPSSSPVIHPDSQVYLSEARQSFGQLFAALFGGAPTWRPAGYPLFLKLCGATDLAHPAALALVAMLQAVIGGAACGLLATTLMRVCLRTRGGRVLACVLITLYSLSAFAGPWDAVILTESLSASVCLLLLCAVAAFASRPTVARSAGMFAALVALAWLRDANVALGVCALLMAGWMVLWRFKAMKRGRRIASVAEILVCGLLLAIQSRAAVASGRADWPLTNALSRRVLYDQNAFDTFVKQYGLPAETAPLAGRLMWDGWRDAPGYNAWLVGGGRWAYARYLNDHPETARQLAASAFQFAAADQWGPELVQYLDPLRTAAPMRTGLAIGLRDLVTLPMRGGSRLAGTFIAWSIAATLAVMAVVLLMRDGHMGLIYAAALTMLFIVVQVLSTFFLDGCEESRHNHLAYCLATLGVWLAFILIVDDVLARRAEG